MINLRTVTFVFDMYEDHPFQGFAIGTTWNGFDNVAVTLETAREMDNFFSPLSDDDVRFASLPLNDDGLIDIGNGWTTVIID